MKDELYKTKRVVYVTKSVDNRIPTGEYDVYMNYASTLGIVQGELFMPLAMACMFGVDWEYENGTQQW